MPLQDMSSGFVEAVDNSPRHADRTSRQPESHSNSKFQSRIIAAQRCSAPFPERSAAAAGDGDARVHQTYPPSKAQRRRGPSSIPAVRHSERHSQPPLGQSYTAGCAEEAAVALAVVVTHSSNSTTSARGYGLSYLRRPGRLKQSLS